MSSRTAAGITERLGRQPSEPSPLEPRHLVEELLSHFPRVQLVYVVAKLGIADLLKDGPRTAEMLASATRANSQALRRVLRAVVSLGIFIEREDGHFALNPAGELLQQGKGFLGPAIGAGEKHWPVCGALLHTVRTGETAFDHVFGMGYFEYAVQQPGLRGVLFDTPSIVERAQRELAAAGVGERCEVKGGDFFQSVPTGGDAYLLAWVLHDWDDARAGRILRNCRTAMSAHAKLLILETVMPPRAEYMDEAARRAGAPNFLNDVSMMLNTGGQERTEPEFRRLLAGAGFHVRRVVPTAFRRRVSVIEALPVPV